MTSNVICVLNKIKDLEIFKDEFYFIGGTALSYFINHKFIIRYQAVNKFPLKMQKSYLTSDINRVSCIFDIIML